MNLLSEKSYPKLFLYMTINIGRNISRISSVKLEFLKINSINLLFFIFEQKLK